MVAGGESVRHVRGEKLKLKMMVDLSDIEMIRWCQANGSVSQLTGADWPEQFKGQVYSQSQDNANEMGAPGSNAESRPVKSGPVESDPKEEGENGRLRASEHKIR